MKLGELFFDLGIKSGGGAATLRDFMGKVGGLRMSTLGATAAISALGAAMAGTVRDSANAAVAFQTFTNVTGLSWRELQKWQMVGERANVPAAAMAAAVTKLQSKLIDLQLRGEGAGLFSLLGVEPGRATETFHVMDRLMQAYKQMPGGVFANVAAGLGLDPVLTNLFAKGPGWFAKQAGEAEGLGMTSKQQKEALAFMLEYQKMWQEIKALSFEIAENIMPVAVEYVQDIATIAGFLREILDDYDKQPKPAVAGSPLQSFRDWMAAPDQKRLAFATAGAAGAVGGVKSTVDVKITGDANDSAFARRVADIVVGQIGSTESQVTYPEAADPNAEFTIPPARP